MSLTLDYSDVEYHNYVGLCGRYGETPRGAFDRQHYTRLQLRRYAELTRPPLAEPSPRSRRLRVYTASKLSQAPLWKRLLNEWTEVEFTARWVTHHVGSTPDEAGFARLFWQHDEDDVRRSDVVLVYAESRIDKLRGALVEAGMGIALGKDVVVVGDHPDYGTWQHHPRVHGATSLPHARKLLEVMAMSVTTDDTQL